jgi:hypothetical protein
MGLLLPAPASFYVHQAFVQTLNNDITVCSPITSMDIYFTKVSFVGHVLSEPEFVNVYRAQESIRCLSSRYDK